MTFDGTITLGSLLQIMAMITGGFYFLYALKSQIAVLTNTQFNFAERMTRIENELSTLAKIAIDIARQDERMTSQDKRLQELSIRIDDLSKLTKLLLPPMRVQQNKKD